MKHKCPYCKVVFECPMENCKENQYQFCSEKCKDMSNKEKNIQSELSEKIFPDGEWH